MSNQKHSRLNDVVDAIRDTIQHFLFPATIVLLITTFLMWVFVYISRFFFHLFQKLP